MRGGEKKAFTLFEILIVMALVGALVALGVANVAVLPTDYMRTPKGFVLAAIKQARTDSQCMGAGVSLSFDAERRDIVAYLTESGSELWRMNMLGEKPPEEGREDARSDYDMLMRKKIELKFVPRYPEIVNIGAQVAASFSESEIPAMRFYPDSSSTPVKIVLKVEGEEDAVHVPDPFSGHSFAEKPKTRGLSR